MSRKLRPLPIMQPRVTNNDELSDEYH